MPASACNVGGTGLIPGLGNGEGNGNPLSYFCLEIPWTEEAGGVTFHAVVKESDNLTTKQQQRIYCHFVSFPNESITRIVAKDQ